FLAEHLHADHVLLELVAAAGERFVDDEGEEPLEAIDLLKGRAGENPLQLVADRLAGIDLGDGRRPGSRHRPYVTASRARPARAPDPAGGRQPVSFVSAMHRHENTIHTTIIVNAA